MTAALQLLLLPAGAHRALLDAPRASAPQPACSRWADAPCASSPIALRAVPKGCRMRSHLERSHLPAARCLPPSTALRADSLLIFPSAGWADAHTLRIASHLCLQPQPLSLSPIPTSLELPPPFPPLFFFFFKQKKPSLSNKFFSLNSSSPSRDTGTEILFPRRKFTVSNNNASCSLGNKFHLGWRRGESRSRHPDGAAGRAGTQTLCSEAVQVAPSCSSEG